MAGPPLVMLPGALGSYEGTAAAAEALARSRPVIAIAYGPADDLDTLLGRIRSAVDEAGGRADLLGQSYGGWIAQCFVRRHPERVRRLILSHSFALSRVDAWRFRLASKLFSLLPGPLLRALLLKRIGMALRPVARADPDLHRRQLAAVREQVRSPAFLDGLVAQQRCMRQSLEGPIADRPPVATPTLIIESDNDPLIGAKARAALRALHPEASLLRFEQAGHVSAIVETGFYVSAVESFLAGDFSFVSRAGPRSARPSARATR